MVSNLEADIPAEMPMLPHMHGVLGGLVLALSSALAGNQLIVCSVANITVADAASRTGGT
jgi:Na+/H+ antiporter NhaD/arsenite permease-like protein